MTLIRQRPESRTLAWREEIRYLSVRREDSVASPATSAELLDIGAPGGPAVPSGQIRLPTR